jgi:hypothetical protein
VRQLSDVFGDAPSLDGRAETLQSAFVTGLRRPGLVVREVAKPKEIVAPTAGYGIGRGRAEEE